MLEAALHSKSEWTHYVSSQIRQLAEDCIREDREQSAQQLDALGHFDAAKVLRKKNLEPKAA
jgi:hypothetical protein